MAQALLILLIISLLGVGGTAASGLLVWTGQLTVRAHIGVALPSVILVLLAQTLSIFYFVGTGVWVKDMAREHRLDGRHVALTRTIKRELSPWSLGAALVAMGTFISGGAIDAGRMPPLVHLLLALLTLGVCLVTTYRSIVFVGMNLDLQQEVERAIAERES